MEERWKIGRKQAGTGSKPKPGKELYHKPETRRWGAALRAQKETNLTSTVKNGEQKNRRADKFKLIRENQRERREGNNIWEQEWLRRGQPQDSRG